MKIKVRIIMMSHLSDVSDTLGINGSLKDQRRRLNFVKFLMIKYPDTNTEVDGEVEHELFLSKHPQFK